MLTNKNLTEELIANIQSKKLAAKKTESGEIVELFDGVAVVTGLQNASYLELVNLPHNLKGVILDLREKNLAILVFGDYTKLSVGERVTATGKVLSIPVSQKLLGRVIDPLGVPVDGLIDLPAEQFEELEKIAPGIVYRKGVTVPLQTGIKAIDSLIPIGRGQRELIIGDRQVGKTTLVVDTILNQKGEDVICVYVAIGQKEAKVAQVLSLLQEHGAMEYTVIVSAPASAPASMQYIAPYAGTAVAEYFLRQGKDILVIYDDLTKHAWSYRQISLILKRPAGREAYPGDVFYLHSRLLERACRIHEKYGGGSITALPIIETQEGDISGYIPTNVISITDGQVFLEKDLFNAGMRPAINVGASVSRVGSSAQPKAIKQVAASLKMELAQYRSLAAFSQFASELDESTKQTLDRGARMYELLKQDKNAPLSMAKEAVVLWLGTKGYINKIPLNLVAAFEAEALVFLEASYKSILETIKKERLISEATEKQLVKFATDFVETFTKLKVNLQK